MDTRCRRCSKTFQTNILGDRYCPSCAMIEEEKYQQVRELVKANPGISMGLVAEITGLSSGKIISYVKDEKLEYVGESYAYVLCEDCGAKIKTGRYCAKCKPKHQTKAPQVLLTARNPVGRTSGQMFTAGKGHENSH